MMRLCAQRWRVVCLAAGIGLTSAGIAGLPARADDAASSAAAAPPPPQYMLPEEQKAFGKPADPVLSPDAVETKAVMTVRVGRLFIERIPAEGKTIISSHPEIADIHVEDPDFLFVHGLRAGETLLVVADKNMQPIFSVHLVVIPADAPGDEDSTSPDAPPTDGDVPPPPAPQPGG